jgi:hypothetical protein
MWIKAVEFSFSSSAWERNFRQAPLGMRSDECCEAGLRENCVPKPSLGTSEPRNERNLFAAES